jgi:peptidoglycan hydrolase-like protein with peptidoglycan-binding domain
MTRGRVLLTVAMVIVAIGAVVGGIELFGKAKPAKAASGDNAAATSTASVVNRSLTAQTNVSATLGYAGSYGIVNQAVGNYSELPSVGDIVAPGQILYEVGGEPVVLLAGSTPAYRTLVAGISGPDAQELNNNLVALGYGAASLQGSAAFGTATAAAVTKLQAHLGISQTGVLAVDQVVFLPTAARVTAVSATLGTPAQAGATVATATSTTRQVVVALDATQQANVKVGDQVTITLPDTTTTPGVVTTVGTVATAPSTEQGQANTPTIEVDVTPSDPTATGTLDQAPVLVAITTASVTDALVVPVSALLALAGGGYAVEVVASDATHQLVGVTLGLFDDADGLVQITSSSVHAGDHVVVPAS